MPTNAPTTHSPMNTPSDATTTTAHPQVNDDDIKTHNKFLIQFINSLIYRAKKEDKNYSVTRQATSVGEVESVVHFDRTRQLSFSRTQQALETFDHVRFYLVNINEFYINKEDVNTVSI